MLKTISFPIICLMLILSIGFISANILIAGTVYDGKPNLIKSGVLVNITCDSDILQTTSLSDGAYAVVFDTDSCTSVLVESEYDVTEIIMEVEDDSPQTTTTTSSGGGSGSSRSSNLRYYFCGNGVCESGETSSTCIDCNECSGLCGKQIGEDNGQGGQLWCSCDEPCATTFNDCCPDFDYVSMCQ